MIPSNKCTEIKEFKTTNAPVSDLQTYLKVQKKKKFKKSMQIGTGFKCLLHLTQL